MRRIRTLRPGLHALEVTTPELSVRCIVLRGSEQAVVWDTATEPADMAAIEALLGSLPFYVIYSHADWDHVFGTAGFARAPIFVIGHEACGRRFADELPRTLEEMKLAQPGRWESTRLVAPDMMFRRRLCLDLGDLTLELHHLPGHTEDCIVGWLPQWGIWLAGDATEKPLPVINEAALLPAWLDSLENWAARRDLTQAIAAHGGIDGRESLERTIAYLRHLTRGETINLPADLDDFYQRTHKTNLELTRRLADDPS